MSAVPENTADGRQFDSSHSSEQSGSKGTGGTKRNKVQDAAQEAGQRVSPLLTLWKKISNDWVFNWSSGLAYTFLTSILPIFLAILGIAGFVLGAISPASLTQLEDTLARSFPGGSNGLGGQLVAAALRQLHHSAGIFVVFGILGAIIAGSGLFLSLESAFGIVFRVKGRSPLPQRIMAVSMVLFYVVLVPLMVLASVLPAAVLHVFDIGTSSPAGAFLIQALGLLVALASGVLFFGAIYLIVPNRKMQISQIWKGTLLAAALLVLYELVFPIYVSLFLHPNNYGSLVGFAILLLTFFYYLAFIVLLGAEVNSTTIGLRPTTQPLSGLMQELQARDELIEPPQETREAGGSHAAA